MSKYDLEIGKRYGRLVVTRRDFSRYVGDTACQPYMVCVCDCGAVKSIKVHSLWEGRTTSCGCAHREQLTDRNTTHGHTVRTGGQKLSPEYNAWQGMKKRCYNPANEDYKNYGGRGIEVCAEWIDDFAAFLEHAGPSPSELHSIDRIRVNGNYEPGNVKWSTATEQVRNRRIARTVLVNGETMPLIEAIKIFGVVGYDTARYRQDIGWSDMDIISVPAGEIK